MWNSYIAANKWGGGEETRLRQVPLQDRMESRTAEFRAVAHLAVHVALMASVSLNSGYTVRMGL